MVLHLVVTSRYQLTLSQHGMYGVCVYGVCVYVLSTEYLYTVGGSGMISVSEQQRGDD